MIYLDYAATTPTDPRVKEAMLPYFTEKFENPSANFYKSSREIRDDLECARTLVLNELGDPNGELIFAGSGTESCNLAILGFCRANKSKGNHIITTEIEHPAVLKCFEQLEQEGFEISYLKPDSEGLISPEQLKKNVNSETIFCSIIYANNEIGVVQNMSELGEICKKNNVIFHTDACQAGCYLNLNVDSLKIDLMTLNGSKIYGPKGIGVLYKKSSIELEPLVYGGGQEYGLRSGTENISAIIGFAKALEIANEFKDSENKRLSFLRDFVIEKLLKIPNSKLNGHATERLANNINISFEGINIEDLLLKLDEKGFCLSSGSACSAKTSTASHVISALGVENNYAKGTLRITLGRQTTKKDLDKLIEILPKLIEESRKFSL